MFKAFEFCIPTRGIKVPSSPDWLHEVKYDGYHLWVERDGDRVRLDPECAEPRLLVSSDLVRFARLYSRRQYMRVKSRTVKQRRSTRAHRHNGASQRGAARAVWRDTTMGRRMRVKEVNVWMRDDVIKALRFKATNCVVQEKRCNDIADKIKRGDILIVHNPDRNKEANASCNNVHIALQQNR